jgi:hypothetical protein
VPPGPIITWINFHFILYYSQVIYSSYSLQRELWKTTTCDRKWWFMLQYQLSKSKEGYRSNGEATKRSCILDRECSGHRVLYLFIYMYILRHILWVFLEMGLLVNGKIYHKSEDLFVASPLLQYPSLLLDSSATLPI